MTETDWLSALATGAPDIIAAYRGIEEERFISVRREVRRRAGAGSAAAIVGQLAILAGALDTIVRQLPDTAFDLPGGESDWTVAQTVGHDISARSGLVLAASLAAGGRWPVDSRTVVPGVPGRADATRDDLLRKLGLSQRLVERAAKLIRGHETDPCPLDHPLVGRLRCGEWLFFAGVHDLMHLDQLHSIAAVTGQPVTAW